MSDESKSNQANRNWNGPKPIAYDAYQRLADAYASRIDSKPHNAYYERPAMLAMWPDLRGKYVLDAGCGPGVYSEELVLRGAPHGLG